MIGIESFKIYCKTDEELKEVLEKMESDGIVWSSGIKATELAGYLPAPRTLHVSARLTHSGRKNDRYGAMSAKDYLEARDYLERRWSNLCQ